MRCTAAPVSISMGVAPFLILGSHVGGCLGLQGKARTCPNDVFRPESSANRRLAIKDATKSRNRYERGNNRRHYNSMATFSRCSTQLAVADYETRFCEGVTVQDAIQRAQYLLERENVPEPMASVTNILSVVLDLPWKTGFRDLQDPSPILVKRRLTKAEASLFSEKIQRRLQHEPIQYLTEKWDFLDYTFLVRAPLLCPRPETEELVMLVLQDMPVIAGARVLDVGCGTGCIGIALANHGALVTAIDIEHVAIETSNENAQAILKENLAANYHASLCSAHDFLPSTKFDTVVSNPPYIPRDEIASLDRQVVHFESRSALTDGSSDDGMDIIRVIIQKLPSWCRPGASCWMEVDPTHPAIIEASLLNHDRVKFVKSVKDMFGQERFVKLQVK